MNTKTRWKNLLITLAILTVTLETLARVGSGAETTFMRVSYGGTAGYQLPLWVNKEAGLAKKYGIDLEPLLIGGGSLNMQALVGGSIQMSQNSASAAIGAALRGIPVVIIATSENKMPFQIVARPENKASVVIPR